MNAMETQSAFAVKENKKNRFYLSIQESSEGGWDYSIFSSVGDLIDGGLLEDEVDIYTAAETIVEMFPELFGRDPDVDEVDYEGLQEFLA